MHYFSLFNLGLLSFAAFASAAPAEDSNHYGNPNSGMHNIHSNRNNTLEARRAKDVVCDGVRTYTPAELHNAKKQACKFENRGEKVPAHRGRRGYPHDFNNVEGFELEGDGPYMEFPVLEDGHLYDGDWDGGEPYTDRIIIIPFKHGKCELAGVVTHSGAVGGGFVECDPLMP